jgi:putative transposase
LAVNHTIKNGFGMIKGKKGYPKFPKNNRSVEYKHSGGKLSNDRKKITFTDKKNIGTVLYPTF